MRQPRRDLHDCFAGLHDPRRRSHWNRKRRRVDVREEI